MTTPDDLLARDPARGGRAAGGPVVASLRRLGPRRGGRPGGGRRGTHPPGDATDHRNGPAPGCRSPLPGTRWTACGTATASARSPPHTDRQGEGHARADDTDDRLALLFACCHPALAPDARLALTLRAVVGSHHPADRAGLPRPRVDACPEGRPGEAKDRLDRHRADRSRHAQTWQSRLDDVLAVVYVMFNEGFVSSTGPTQDRDLAADAVWLAGVIATSLPDEAEAWGLAALLTIQHARSRARFADGDLVLLRDQDRGLWDPRRDRRGRAADRARRLAPTARALPTPGRDRGGPRPPARAGPRPTGSRSRCRPRSSRAHDPSPS